MSGRKHQSGSHRNSRADARRSNTSRTSGSDGFSEVSGRTSMSMEYTSWEMVTDQSDTSMYPGTGPFQTQLPDQTFDQFPGNDLPPPAQPTGTVVPPAPEQYWYMTPEQCQEQHGPPGPVATNYGSHGSRGSCGGSDDLTASVRVFPRSSESPQLPQQLFANKEEKSGRKRDKTSRHEMDASRHDKDEPSSHEKKKKRDKKEERKELSSPPWITEPRSLLPFRTVTREDDPTYSNSPLHLFDHSRYPPPSPYPTTLDESDLRDPAGYVGHPGHVSHVGQTSQVNHADVGSYHHGVPHPYQSSDQTQEDDGWVICDADDMEWSAGGSSSGGRRYAK